MRDKVIDLVASAIIYIVWCGLVFALALTFIGV